MKIYFTMLLSFITLQSIGQISDKLPAPWDDDTPSSDSLYRSAVRVYGVFETASHGIAYIDNGDIVYLISLKPDKISWIAKYHGTLGSVKESYLEDTKQYERFKTKFILKYDREDSINTSNQEKEDKKNELNRIALRKAAMIKKYGQSIGMLIASGHFKIGMTKTMITDAIGEPDDINRTVTARSITEQWIYGQRYLYFTNGILTAFQD